MIYRIHGWREGQQGANEGGLLTLSSFIVIHYGPHTGCYNDAQFPAFFEEAGASFNMYTVGITEPELSTACGRR